MPQPNFTDKTIWTGDNLDILRGMNSETVDQMVEMVTGAIGKRLRYVDLIGKTPHCPARPCLVSWLHLTSTTGRCSTVTIFPCYGV